MPRIWTAKITQSRLTWSPFSAESMMEIGNVTLNSILDRMSHALDVTDSSSKPLTDRYAKLKIQRNRAPVRDWEFRGVLKRSLKVKSASQDKVTLGPVTQEANMILAVRRKDNMWGLSPHDEQTMRAIIRYVLLHTRVVRVVKGLKVA